MLTWLFRAHIQISLSCLAGHTSGLSRCGEQFKMNILLSIPFFFEEFAAGENQGFRSADIDLVEPGIIYQFVQFLQFMFIDAAVQQGASMISRLRILMRLKRFMYLFFSASSSSKNMMEPRLRLLYRSVKDEPASFSRVCLMMDMTG